MEPVHEGFADLSTGARLHYVEMGPAHSGIPVIALHGLLGTAMIDLDNVITWLAESYRVLGPSLRGYGQSTPKPRAFPLDFYQRDAADVLAFMDALDIPQAHLVGYSDGGEVALLAAALQPERFTSVTVIGAVGYFGPDMRAAAQALFPGDWITQEKRDLHSIAHADQFILGWIRAVRSIIDSGGDLSLSQAPRISAPLLMFLGDQDRLNPVEYGQRFVAGTPRGRLEVLSCGHGVHVQQWEAFKALVGPFIAGAD